MKKYLFIILLSIIVIIAFNFSSASSDTINIGMAIELTGEGSSTGENILNGAKLAFKECKNKKINLIFEDTQTSVEGAIKAANNLLFKNVYVILSSWSFETIPIIPLAEDENTVIISVSAGSEEIGTISKYAFRTWTNDKLEAITMADFAYNDLNTKKGIVVYSTGPWETNLKKSFITEFNNLGGDVTEIGQIELDNWKASITKAKSKNPEFIYLATAYTLDEILKEIYVQGIKAPILTNSWAENPEYISSKLKIANGIYYSKYYNSTNAFSKKYFEEYNKKPNTPSDVAYDTIKIICEAIDKGVEKEELKNYLKKINYSGASGKISFDNNGDRTSREVTIKQIKNGEFIKIK
jgi:branched-chain amino acid transport system substrate-binding protein